MYTDTFSFGEQILLDNDAHVLGLSNSMARPMQLRCYVFNRVSPVKHWRDILNCGSKWLSFSKSYRRIGPKPRLLFPSKQTQLLLLLANSGYLQGN